MDSPGRKRESRPCPVSPVRFSIHLRAPSESFSAQATRAFASQARAWMLGSSVGKRRTPVNHPPRWRAVRNIASLQPHFTRTKPGLHSPSTSVERNWASSQGRVLARSTAMPRRISPDRVPHSRPRIMPMACPWHSVLFSRRCASQFCSIAGPLRNRRQSGPQPGFAKNEDPRIFAIFLGEFPSCSNNSKHLTKNDHTASDSESWRRAQRKIGGGTGGCDHCGLCLLERFFIVALHCLHVHAETRFSGVLGPLRCRMVLSGGKPQVFRRLGFASVIEAGGKQAVANCVCARSSGSPWLLHTSSACSQISLPRGGSRYQAGLARRAKASIWVFLSPASARARRRGPRMPGRSPTSLQERKCASPMPLKHLNFQFNSCAGRQRLRQFEREFEARGSNRHAQIAWRRSQQSISKQRGGLPRNPALLRSAARVSEAQFPVFRQCRQP